MKRPEFPPMRLRNEYSETACPECGSSMMFKRFLLFGPRPGCIQEKCHNYGGVRPAGSNPPPPRDGWRPAPPPNPPRARR